MNESHTEPLGRELLDALEAEKTPTGAPAAARARVFERLQMTLPAMAPRIAEAPAAAAPAATAPSPSGFWTAGRMGVVAAAFVAGSGIGAAGHAWLAAPEGGVSITPPAPPPRETSTPAPVPPQSSPSAASVEQVPLPVVASPSASTQGADADLKAERALLDRARSALARGDGEASLSVLNTHARRFPHGLLEEEREALAVKAFVSAGRSAEAKSRGARFRSKFPDSLLTQTIDDTLGSIP